MRAGLIPPVISLVVLLVSAGSIAQADPLALRTPVPGASVSGVLGTSWAGLGAYVVPSVGVTLEGRSNSALGLSVGGRFTLAGSALGFGVEAFGSVGALYLRYAQNTAITATIALQLRYRQRQWIVALDAAAPLEAQIAGEGLLRLPALGEIWFAVDAGGFWAGAQGSFGAAFLPGFAPEPVAQVSLFLTVPFSIFATHPTPAAAPAAPARPPTTGPW